MTEGYNECIAEVSKSFNSRQHQPSRRNSELKNISLETTKSEKQKEKKMNRNEESVWGTVKRKNYASLKFQGEKTNKQTNKRDRTLQ